MRSWISILFFCLLLSDFIAAQDAVEDSLNSVLLKSVEDTNKVKTYYELIKRIRKYDFDRAEKLAQEQLALSQKLKFPWGIGKSHNAMGLIEVGRKRAYAAIAHFNSGGAVFESVKDFGNLQYSLYFKRSN